MIVFQPAPLSTPQDAWDKRARSTSSQNNSSMKNRKEGKNSKRYPRHSNHLPPRVLNRKSQKQELSAPSSTVESEKCPNLSQTKSDSKLGISEVQVLYLFPYSLQMGALKFFMEDAFKKTLASCANRKVLNESSIQKDFKIYVSCDADVIIDEPTRDAYEIQADPYEETILEHYLAAFYATVEEVLEIHAAGSRRKMQSKSCSTASTEVLIGDAEVSCIQPVQNFDHF